jgi:hypothetical protein
MSSWLSFRKKQNEFERTEKEKWEMNRTACISKQSRFYLSRTARVVLSSLLLVESLLPIGAETQKAKDFKNQMVNSIKVENMGKSDKMGGPIQKIKPEYTKEDEFMNLIKDIGNDTKFLSSIKINTVDSFRDFIEINNKLTKVIGEVDDIIRSNPSFLENAIKKLQQSINDPKTEEYKLYQENKYYRWVVNYVLGAKQYRYTETRLMDVVIKDSEYDLQKDPKSMKEYNNLIKPMSKTIKQLLELKEKYHENNKLSDDVKLKIDLMLDHAIFNYLKIKETVITLYNEGRKDKANAFMTDLQEKGVANISNYLTISKAYIQKDTYFYWDENKLPGISFIKFIDDLLSSKEKEDVELLKYINQIKINGNTSYKDLPDYKDKTKNISLGDVFTNTDSVFSTNTGWKGTKENIKEFYNFLKDNNVKEFGISGLDPEFFDRNLKGLDPKTGKPDIRKTDISDFYHSSKIFIYFWPSVFQKQYEDAFKKYPVFNEFPYFIRSIQFQERNKAVSTLKASDIQRAIDLSTAFMYTFHFGLIKAETTAKDFIKNYQNLASIKSYDKKLYDDLNLLSNNGINVEILKWDEKALIGYLSYAYIIASFYNAKTVSYPIEEDYTISPIQTINTNRDAKNNLYTVYAEMRPSDIQKYMDKINVEIPVKFKLQLPLKLENAEYNSQINTISIGFDKNTKNIMNNLRRIYDSNLLNNKKILSELNIGITLLVERPWPWRTESFETQTFNLFAQDFNLSSQLGIVEFPFDKTGDNVKVKAMVPHQNKVWAETVAESNEITLPFEPFIKTTIAQFTQSAAISAVASGDLTNVAVENGVDPRYVNDLQKAWENFESNKKLHNYDVYYNKFKDLLSNYKIEFVKTATDQQAKAKILKEFLDGNKQLDENVIRAFLSTKLGSQILQYDQAGNPKLVPLSIEVSDVYAPERFEFEKSNENGKNVVYGLLVGPRITKRILRNEKGDIIDQDPEKRLVVGTAVRIDVPELNLIFGTEALWTLDKDVYKRFGLSPDRVAFEIFKDRPALNRIKDSLVEYFRKRKLDKEQQQTVLETVSKIVTSVTPDRIIFNRDTFGYGKYGSVYTEIKIVALDVTKAYNKSVGKVLGESYKLELELEFSNEAPYSEMFETLKHTVNQAIFNFSDLNRKVCLTNYSKFGRIYGEADFNKHNKLTAISLELQPRNKDWSIWGGYNSQSELWYFGIKINFDSFFGLW